MQKPLLTLLCDWLCTLEGNRWQDLLFLGVEIGNSTLSVQNMYILVCYKVGMQWHQEYHSTITPQYQDQGGIYCGINKETGQIKENNVTASHHKCASVCSLYFLSVHHLFPPLLCLSTELKTLPRIRFEDSCSVAHFCDLFVTRRLLTLLSVRSLSKTVCAHGLMIKWSSHSLSLCFARAMYFCQHTTKTKQKNHPYWFSCQAKRLTPAERRWIERLYSPNRQSRVAMREIYTLECPAGALFVLPRTVWHFLLPAQPLYKENSGYKVYFFPSLLLLPFTSQQYCHRERIECSGWKIITTFFHSVTPSIKRYPSIL